MINMLDLKEEFIEIEAEVIDTVVNILKSTRYILGPHVEGFEQELALYNGVEYAVGVASGTSALHLSLAAIDVAKGDEVITTPFTFFASIESILYRGAKPVFVDIDKHTLNINTDLIEENITNKTKAIIPVHLFGLPCNMEAIIKISDKYGLAIIEDCAQSFGSTYKGKHTGSFGTTGCFSFYPSKNLGCYGDGGAVITNNRNIDEKIKRLRNHGASASYTHDVVGFNSRLDEIQAGILRIKLKKIDEKNSLRRKNVLLYNEYLTGYVTTPIEPEGYISNYHQYTIRSPRREAIKQALSKEDIASVVYYPIPMHMQNALDGLYKEGDFPIAEEAARQVLSLPIYPGMQANDIEKICQVIIRCLNEG
ncbi:MAG: DegT/DnrJ/EryC1/StrS family aminotransferase [Candidatus Magnetoovum sp. WYHC-5]|nr:DegT/DnrJ/EryC1/StrS family aminotransferase [Candidatus Magnetoovum sp. WYHC-5]